MLLHGDITDQILKSYYHVLNGLGPGFLEKVYKNAMVHMLQKNGLIAVPQRPIKVHFEGMVVGDYFADIMVNECVIVELKAQNELSKFDQAQLINYLKATSIEVGLLLNFGGEKPEFVRRVLTNDKKPNLKLD